MRRRFVLALLASAAGSPPVKADSPAVEEVVVVGVTPLKGGGLDVSKIPASVQSLSATDLAEEGSPSLLGSLADRAGSVSINDTLGDRFQPDIAYRGFTASPVLGTPQGLAVFQNGVRVNEAFGDTVDWDLLPDFAIDRVDIVSANPVYGLNALGGAIVISMKDGFTHQGFDADLSVGSFGQRGGSFDFGRQAGDVAAYVAGTAINQGGWRQFSSDQLRQVYADLAARSEKARLDISFTGANNRLYGEGTTPEQELAVGRSLVFTTPQNNINQLEFVILSGSYQATDALSLQANAYRREFHQTVVNGNTTDYTACTNRSGALCQSDGITGLSTATGSLIPDLSAGGTIPIGETDVETIHAVSAGAALQASDTGSLAGLVNNVVFGGGVDQSWVDFQSSADIGVVDGSLQVQPSAYVVDTPENSGFNATPVSLSATSQVYALFVTDSLDLTPALTATASARFNDSAISLADRLGADLSGDNRYRRVNPALGATYKIAPSATLYAGFSQNTRTPTPSEIECSNPAQPCLLPSSLSSDPPTLKQVVSRSYEAGLRGTVTLSGQSARALTWNADLFRTDLTDDIYGVATSISSGYFENIGSTRRQGGAAGLTYRADGWSVTANYSLVDATFQSALTLPSANNPYADPNGTIHVLPGDRLPAIPKHQLKIGVDYRPTADWIVGATAIYNGSQYLRGDESNQTPPLAGYAVVNLHGSYQVSDHFALFATVKNLFDARYATFGQYGDPTGIGAPGVPANAVSNGPGVDNRFLSPAAPLTIASGLRVRY
jgi:iron complex outermembrane receptor protein